MSDFFENEKIVDIEINKEVRQAFLDYSMSVIVSRALPDVRDGLKPVHRRILYTMFENNLYPNAAYRKSADTVGSVLGRYHPHGDASVYDAMVRLAQSFSMRYTLVDGHGNFGSVDGDPAAAYRYTESRMSKISIKMLEDIDKDTIDWGTNYDDRLKEPSVLPARFPNLLVNGSTGIAVGMATNIPPHNLREVVDGMCALIDDPEITDEGLMEYIKGPDFPTAGIIMGRGGIRQAYTTGRGKIVLRSRAEIQETKSGRYQISVTEIPYQVNKARLIESIANLVKDKRIEGISDINDYSSREGMEIVIELKKDANPELVLNQLYSFSQMQITYGIINLALVGGIPKILTLKEMLGEYIRHQESVIRRRTEFDLKKAQERAHILRGYVVALDNIDEVVEILKKSPNVQEGKEALMERFGLDELQADAIVKMRLGQLTGLERDKILNELAELEQKIAEYEAILADESKILAIVKEETKQISDKFADERRTEILNVSGNVEDEDLIPVEECVITLTKFGYLKRQTLESYQAQHRGGKGIKGMTRREEDETEIMISCSTHDYLMFFTNFGKCYRMKGYRIPESSRTSKGMNVINLLPIEEGEKVTAMVRVKDFESETDYFCMITRNGIIKRTRVDAYNTNRKGGLKAIVLDEGDELIKVLYTNGAQDLLLATNRGMSIRFAETGARPIGRTARGVKAIELKEGDSIVGAAAIEENTNILTVTETGYGRRSECGDYRLQKRGGYGLINYKTAKYGMVAAVAAVKDDEDVILISESGIIIRMSVSEISTYGRPSKGVKVMKLGEDDKVISMVVTSHVEEELEEELEEESEQTVSSEESVSEQSAQEQAQNDESQGSEE
ncbi:MAG: DNA gyrase subunit A [Clostridia bacterium]|nr:DNA gyrase subunit A [Clostridia bacterium]